MTVPDTAAAPENTGMPSDAGSPRGDRPPSDGGSSESGGPPAAGAPDRARRQRLTRSLLGAAGLIAGLTILARVVGFGRIVVFTGTVGYHDVGDTYQAINTIPNIIFEIVAGGALAAAVVPLLAGAADRGERRTVDQVTSALLTWVIVLLAPLAIVIALAAGPIVAGLLGPEATAADGEFGRLLLRVFAPQLVLYGVGVVLTGVLQAHRRFAGPALAPLLSSVTVIGAYLVYGRLESGAETAADVGRPGQLVLAVGTTLGVVMLSLSLLLPLRGTGVRIRPTLRFPSGSVNRVRRLVGSGVATVVGQQLATLVALLLANRWAAPDGSYVAFMMAQTVFLLPWAVLAVPLATSAYPRLAAAWERSDQAAYRATLRPTLHGVLILSALATAALIAGAEPIAALVTAAGDGDASRPAVAAGIACFAPGLLGYGLFALLSRALYAAERPGAAAGAVLGGWAVTAGAAVVLVVLLPAEDRVAALAVGNTVGMTVLGAALLLLTARRAGPGTLRGTGRLVLALVPATAMADAAGAWVAAALPGESVLAIVGAGAVAAVVVLVLFVVLLRSAGRLVGAETDVPLVRPGRLRGKRPGMLDPTTERTEPDDRAAPNDDRAARPRGENA
ncbi:murein biosynthesis integral membrane protein MurJ [Cryptosporangium minutisporangium]|uniref:murein biosynthesis integral membrane protein MurJ n=1 Tax=Cryptosporangium minutisporangium TaxID=113569 RepID=UPI0035F059DE